MRKTLLIVLVLLLILLVVLAVRYNRPSSVVVEPEPTEHIYATWDTMELDKCVAAWLIVRFVDKDAKFIFYPQGAEIEEGIVFDVPGATWSRKHRKCTSDCILEYLDINDPAVEEIVAVAHQTELNYWQLDQFPIARKCLEEVQEIFNGIPDPLKCLEKTQKYLDNLYAQFQKPFTGGDKNSKIASRPTAE